MPQRSASGAAAGICDAADSEFNARHPALELVDPGASQVAPASRGKNRARIATAAAGPSTHSSSRTRVGDGATRRNGLLDVPRLAEHLAVSEGFIRRLVEQRRVPYVKLGKFIRFHPDEIATWVDSCSVERMR